MLFNSVEYIFFFLPFVFFTTFFLNRRRHFTAAKIFLILASLFFYAWWNPVYLPIMLGSILFNYLFSLGIQQYKSKTLLALTLVGNVGLLVYYKYADFLIENFNAVFGTQFSLLHLLLPLAISFYTFQTIAYQVDCYKGIAKNRNFIDFALFISFFPQLSRPYRSSQRINPPTEPAGTKKAQRRKYCAGNPFICYRISQKSVGGGFGVGYGSTRLCQHIRSKRDGSLDDGFCVHHPNVLRFQRVQRYGPGSRADIQYPSAY